MHLQRNNKLKFLVRVMKFILKFAPAFVTLSLFCLYFDLCNLILIVFGSKVNKTVQVT